MEPINLAGIDLSPARESGAGTALSRVQWNFETTHWKLEMVQRKSGMVQWKFVEIKYCPVET